ncbi:hypothetical protein OPV22_004047 [Ensete ventricosum]|uniref:Secreted protein n=1 Tax=Ensete ventricosum TaxID=4639 RepID=A0AAV8S2H3_ENSVE|nr:hypothetical protein OPV22_004047 [Ensete ventricosum]
MARRLVLIFAAHQQLHSLAGCCHIKSKERRSNGVNKIRNLSFRDSKRDATPNERDDMRACGSPSLAPSTPPGSRL